MCVKYTIRSGKPIQYKSNAVGALLNVQNKILYAEFGLLKNTGEQCLNIFVIVNTFFHFFFFFILFTLFLVLIRPYRNDITPGALQLIRF